MSSKRREVQKVELGIASPRSSLNLGCFRTVGGPFMCPFGTWSGALSGLGRGPFRNLVLCPFGTWLGCFQKHTGEKEKTTSEKCKASMRALSFCLVGFAHTRRMHAVQNEACKKIQGEQLWVLTKRCAPQQNK